jgi:protein O-GlcNAc transferase
LTFDVTYPTPELVDPPCLVSGGVTFGCLAPLYKITPQAIELWSGILREAPRSSLLLRGSALRSEGARRYVAEAFARCGVGGERIRLLGPAAHFEFLETYNQIDIALDTFPYNGGTTTTEAIWQGVPVVSYSGDRWVSRTSASLLRGGGLSQFVHGDLEGYAAQAVSLANAPETPAMLRELRRNMRERLRASKVCDTAGFAREMEGIYLKIGRPGAMGRAN